MSGLPEWRSQTGHAWADAIQDTLAKYDTEAMRQVDPALIADAVFRDLGFDTKRRRQRIPEALRASVVQWCRGVVEG